MTFFIGVAAAAAAAADVVVLNRQLLFPLVLYCCRFTAVAVPRIDSKREQSKMKQITTNGIIKKQFRQQKTHSIRQKKERMKKMGITKTKKKFFFSFEWNLKMNTNSRVHTHILTYVYCFGCLIDA